MTLVQVFVTIDKYTTALSVWTSLQKSIAMVGLYSNESQTEVQTLSAVTGIETPVANNCKGEYYAYTSTPWVCHT